MPDRAQVATFAKLVVKGLLNPWAAAERAAELAIDHIVGQLPEDRRPTYERLLKSVTNDVQAALGNEEPAVVEQAFELAGAALAVHGLRVEQLVGLRLDAHDAVRNTIEAAGNRPSDKERAGALGRVVILAVYQALLKDEPALAEIELGFKRAVLDALAKLDGLADDVARAIRKLSGAALLEVRHRPLRDGDPPSAALLAEAAVVPFEPRPEYDELRAWCATDQTVALRVYTGPGGRGKTRLLLEVCWAMRAEGWRAGFLADAAHWCTLGWACARPASGVACVRPSARRDGHARLPIRGPRETRRAAGAGRSRRATG